MKIIENFFVEIKKNTYTLLNAALAKRRLSIRTYMFYNTRDIFDLIMKIKKDMHVDKDHTTMDITESLHVYFCAEAAKKIPGDAAEMGVYKGNTAAIIAEALPNKRLHLFDTFEGLPETGKNDEQFKKGEYVGTFKDVKRNLSKYKKILYYKGLFPETAKKCKQKKFAFVHIDFDLYDGTLASLNHFYPLMSAGGIFLIHDYPMTGIQRAIRDFLKDKPESCIVINGTQGLIVKQAKKAD